MNIYAISIDKVMLLNALETDINETLELLNFVFFAYLLFLAIIPSIFILKLQINYGKIWKELIYKIIVIFISLILGSGLIFINYKMLSSTARSHKNLKHIIIPFNYIDGYYGLIRIKLRSHIKFVDLTEDVKLLEKNNSKKNLIILVVGEAARANNFSLNGYSKDTNEYLKNKNLIYYNNVYSCGTSTAISVPCMFSNLPRKNYEAGKGKNSSNLLDFLSKAGVNILWRENNSGCKGVCKRVPTDDLIENKNKNFCNSKECFDEILIENLDSKILNMTDNNNLIVLHQKGSHGPSYYLRYPEKFLKYKPICKTEYFDKCTNEEIINSYNNTINYTSFILNSIIENLQKYEKEYNVAMIYISDHGQSLGENGMYLHGAPYKFSPIEQRHIPLLIWFSKDFKNTFNLNEECLKNRKNKELSHDNLFHSVLGIFNVKTKYYDEKLDLFFPCRNTKK